MALTVAGIVVGAELAIAGRRACWWGCVRATRWRLGAPRCSSARSRCWRVIAGTARDEGRSRGDAARAVTAPRDYIAAHGSCLGNLQRDRRWHDFRGVIRVGGRAAESTGFRFISNRFILKP